MKICSDKNNCVFECMPKHNQNHSELLKYSKWKTDDKHTNLCVPTTLAMLWDAQTIHYNPPYKKNSNADRLAWSIDPPKVYNEKISSLATALSTTNAGTTYLNLYNSGYILSSYCTSAIKSNSNFLMTGISSDIKKIKDTFYNWGNPVPLLLSIDYYTKTIASSRLTAAISDIDKNGEDYRSYYDPKYMEMIYISQNQGHSLAMKGYVGDSILLNDPIDGTELNVTLYTAQKFSLLDEVKKSYRTMTGKYPPNNYASNEDVSVFFGEGNWDCYIDIDGYSNCNESEIRDRTSFSSITHLVKGSNQTEAATFYNNFYNISGIKNGSYYPYIVTVPVLESYYLFDIRRCK